VKVIDNWLKQLHDEVGSDLFVTVDAPPCIKVHGKIKPISTDLLTDEKTREIVLSVMSERQKEQFRNTQELQFAYSLGPEVRYRMSAFVQQGMVGMVCRRIESRIPNFEELGCPDVMSELSLEKRGIVLFVGATGTGKSTSMAAMVGYRNQRVTGHIITIEDPIEYVHQHGKSLVTQREVGIDTESFEVALRNTLRQAPDVILIGEVRTRETMEHAITFSETGHLVLATLHANNANQATGAGDLARQQRQPGDGPYPALFPRGSAGAGSSGPVFQPQGDHSAAVDSLRGRFTPLGGVRGADGNAAGQGPHTQGRNR